MLTISRAASRPDTKWTFNHETRRPDDERLSLIPRVALEEAIARLTDAGIANRFELVRILAALSGLPAAEVTFNVDLVAFDREPLFVQLAEAKGVSMTNQNGDAGQGELADELRYLEIARREAEVLLLRRRLVPDAEPMLSHILQEYFLNREREHDALRRRHT